MRTGAPPIAQVREDCGCGESATWSVVCRQNGQCSRCETDSGPVGESAGVVLAPVLVQISTPCGVPRSSASAWDTAGASAANSANNTAIHTAQRRCSGSGQGRVACFMMRCRIFRITACHARRVRHGYRAHRGLRPRQPSPCLQSWKKA